MKKNKSSHQQLSSSAHLWAWQDTSSSPSRSRLFGLLGLLIYSIGRRGFGSDMFSSTTWKRSSSKNSSSQNCQQKSTGSTTRESLVFLSLSSNFDFFFVGEINWNPTKKQTNKQYQLGELLWKKHHYINRRTLRHANTSADHARIRWLASWWLEVPMTWIRGEINPWWG